MWQKALEREATKEVREQRRKTIKIHTKIFDHN